MKLRRRAGSSAAPPRDAEPCPVKMFSSEPRRRYPAQSSRPANVGALLVSDIRGGMLRQIGNKHRLGDSPQLAVAGDELRHKVVLR